VACFLLQDYGVRRTADEAEATLIILNDAPVPIRVAAGTLIGTMHPSAGGVRDELNILPSRRVVVVNRPERFGSLGQKRQQLLEGARTELVAHWDDDDIYFPWHLSQTVSTLLSAVRRTGATCAKSGAAWFVTGPRQGPFQCRGIHHNVFEGQMVFFAYRALELGGYPPKDSGQAKALLDAFRCAGELHEWNPPDADVSYVYRWGDGVHHVSGSGDSQASHEKFGAANRDFGDGQPLIAGDDPLAWARERLAGQFEELLRAFRSYLSAEDRDRMSAHLLAAVQPVTAQTASTEACNR
jgi:hypothetical protein